MLANVSLPTSGGRVKNVLRIEIRSSEYMHDMAVVTAVSLDKRRPKIGSPISVTFGTGVFVGYVLSVAKGERHTAVLHCIGATSVCRNARRRSWAGRNDAQIVQEIAKLNKLQAAVEPTPVKHKMVNQTGVSDWQFMVERAKAIGYVLYPRVGQIRFHSRSFELDKYANAAPKLAGAAVLSFTPDLREHVKGGMPKATVAVSGVDANGQPVAGTKDAPGIFARYNTKRVVSSVADAQVAAAAEAALNSWTYRAYAVLLGNPLVRVGGPVFFKNVPGDYEGFWVVQQVAHIITPTSYQTNVTVGIDQLGRGYTAEPPAEPMRDEEELSIDTSHLIDLADVGDPFDPETADPVDPNTAVDTLLEEDDEEVVQPPSQWVVPPVAAEDESAFYGDEYAAVALDGSSDESFAQQIADEPPAWLLERVYG